MMHMHRMEDMYPRYRSSVLVRPEISAPFSRSAFSSCGEPSAAAESLLSPLNSLHHNVWHRKYFDYGIVLLILHPKQSDS